MKIAILSDTHRMVQAAAEQLRLIQPDLILHLGDVVPDALTLAGMFPSIPLKYVKGNCDPGSNAPEELILELEGHRIYMAHGHRHGVKLDIYRIYFAGVDHHADIVLYGHTHVADIREKSGILLINPGSAGFEHTMAILHLEEDRREANLLTF